MSSINTVYSVHDQRKNQYSNLNGTFVKQYKQNHLGLMMSTVQVSIFAVDLIENLEFLICTN